MLQSAAVVSGLHYLPCSAVMLAGQVLVDALPYSIFAAQNFSSQEAGVPRPL